MDFILDTKVLSPIRAVLNSISFNSIYASTGHKNEDPCQMSRWSPCRTAILQCQNYYANINCVSLADAFCLQVNGCVHKSSLFQSPHCDNVQCDDVQCDNVQCDDVQCDNVQCDDVQCDDVQCDDVQCDDVQCDNVQCAHTSN